MASFGEKLRRARESQQRELSQIAEEIRVDVHYLAAIEADHLERLPGGFFTRSFVRQYAAVLGIPASEVKPALEQLMAEEKAPYVPGQEPPRAGSDLPPVFNMLGVKNRPKNRIFGAFVILVVVVAACAVLYAVWLESRDRGLVRIFGGETGSPAGTRAPERSLPAVSKPLTPDVPMLSEPAVTEPVREQSAPLPGPLWFRLDATQETWVRVMSGDRSLFSGTLQPGETRRFSGLDSATLRTGNAGGLEIVANGKLVGPIGPIGQIREVTLTPDEAEISIPARRSPQPSEEDSPDLPGAG